MRLIVVGAGRAAGSLTLAARSSGHQVVGLLARGVAPSWATDLPRLSWTENLPVADLVVIAVRDDGIEEVGSRLAPVAHSVGGAVHMSGFKSVAALRALAEVGLPTGSFHPLQTLPDPVSGAAALPGCWVAVTAPPRLAGALRDLAESMGCKPFPLADESKPLYHAAASAASNYVITALSLASGLFGLAGVPAAAGQPLTEAAVRNAYEMGATSALTGPIARGDRGTVLGQLAAVDGTPYSEGFRALAAATARLASTLDQFPELS